MRSDAARHALRACGMVVLMLLSACGGGGGGSGGSAANDGSTGGGGTATTPVVLTNFATVTVDDGPAALGTGANPIRAADEAFVSVTLCVPGTTTCQTIDHVQVDTGSVGLRIAGGVLNAAMLGGLPHQTDTPGNPVGECYGYVDGYAFGSVRRADFTIGGEKVAAMPVQVLGDGGAFATAPAQCSAGGGVRIGSVSDFGANGIIGIGVTATDCGQYCASGGTAEGQYYDCPASGCGAIIARAANTVAPFEQLPNPVAAMAVDNNGSILTLPAVPSTGSRTVSGTLTFGIGTQTNNALGGAKPLTLSSVASTRGSGLVTVTYNGATLPNSFIDSGSNAYYFVDTSIPDCTAANETGFFCPATPLALSPVVTGENGVTFAAGFTLYNANTLFNSGNAALPGLGGDSATIDGFDDLPSSFDIGLPFFYGRSIYTAIEGRTAGGTAGPFVAIG